MDLVSKSPVVRVLGLTRATYGKTLALVLALVAVLSAGISCISDTAESLHAQTEIRNPTDCVSKSCGGPLHRLDRQPTTLRAAPVIAAAFPHAANAKYLHGPRAGISETRGITPAGRSILLGSPRRYSEFPAAMPAVRLPSLSYADGRTTPRGLSNISFGAGANPDAPQAFILLLKNDASTDEAVAARAYISGISSPIFGPGKGTTLDFRPGSDPDPPDSTWATPRTALTAPADETDTFTVPSRVGTTISGAPPGSSEPAHCGRPPRINLSDLDGSVQPRPGHHRLRRPISHHRHGRIHRGQLRSHDDASHHHRTGSGKTL